MYKATAGIVLPTTIIGSLPRPAWYTANLGNKSFLEAMVNSRFREQYTDALSVYLRDQETAGLDICTDGDCRFDEEVGGQSWTSYPPKHMSGFDSDAVALPGSGVEQLRFELVDGELVRCGIDPEQHVPLLYQPVAFLDRHFDDTAAHLRHDRNRVLVHPHVGRRGRVDVEQQDERRVEDDHAHDERVVAIDGTLHEVAADAR